MMFYYLQAIQAFMAEKKLIVVHVAYDPEAKIWWTESIIEILAQGRERIDVPAAA
jgi:hypothetical protein